MQTGHKHLKRHVGPCGPCVLCSKTSSKYRHFDGLSTHTQTTICNNLPKGDTGSLRQDSCICYACVLQVDHNIGNPRFIPRWIPRLKREKSGKCSVETCKQPLHCNTNLVTPSELEQLLGVKVVCFTVTDKETAISLCREHYTSMYTHIHIKQTCASCGEKAKRGETINRKCPDVAVVNAHLNYITNEAQVMTRDSCVCHTCYKYFHSIAKELATAKQIGNTDKDDKTIEEALFNIKTDIQKLSVKDNLSPSDCINFC